MPSRKQLSVGQENAQIKYNTFNTPVSVLMALLMNYLPCFLDGDDACLKCGFKHKKDGKPCYNFKKRDSRWKGHLAIAPICSEFVNIYCRMCHKYTTFVATDDAVIILGFCGEHLDYTRLMFEFTEHFKTIDVEFEHLQHDLNAYFTYLLIPLLYEHGYDV